MDEIGLFIASMLNGAVHGMKDDWLDFEQFFLEHHKPAALGK